MRTAEGVAAIQEEAQRIWHEDRIRLGLLQMLAEEAKATGATVGFLIDAIQHERVGPIMRRKLDDFMTGVGIPHERVTAMMDDLIDGKETIGIDELAMLAMTYRPGLPTELQAAELRNYAHRLHLRAKRHARLIEEAREMVKAAQG